MLCCDQGAQGPGGQQDLLAKLAQAAAAHPHLQRAVPGGTARTLDDIEAAVRGSAPPSGLLGAFQHGPQGAKHGNALLSLLQGNAGAQNLPFGQVRGAPQCLEVRCILWALHSRYRPSPTPAHSSALVDLSGSQQV